jgi:hypothetical protein
MKKAGAVLLILVIILSAMQLNSSIANPYTPLPSISFLSPYPSWDRCYPNDSIIIKIGIILRETITPETFTPKISYSLDNGENITLTNTTKGEHWAKEYPNQPPVSFTASTTLYNLTEGNHTLRAYSFDAQGKALSTEREFIIDSYYKNPELTLISPKKMNYTSSNVELIFYTNKEYKRAQYILDYHLDSRVDVKINGNVTLTNLPDGLHKIMVLAYCYDEYHDGISVVQGTSFNVSIIENATENENNLPIDDKPIILIVASITIIAVISCIMLGYFIRRKKLSSKQSFF